MFLWRPSYAPIGIFAGLAMQLLFMRTYWFVVSVSPLLNLVLQTTCNVAMVHSYVGGSSLKFLLPAMGLEAANNTSVYRKIRVRTPSAVDTGAISKSLALYKGELAACRTTSYILCHVEFAIPTGLACWFSGAPG